MTEQLTILLVEDTMTQALMLKRILESTSRYTVLIAKNGKQALEILSHSNPDLIISDVNMPEMDGYDLARAIKDDPRASGIPFVLFAALLQRDDIFRIIECGADNFMIKTYDEGYLLARVNDIVANARMRARQSEDDRQWNGVFDGHIVNTHSTFAKVLDMLLSSFATNVQQAQATKEIAK
jgi:response regulator RpfG family c-di-GMP phosphodiesterase